MQGKDGNLKEVFAIFDVKAQYYMSPFVQRNKAEALRGFSDLVNADNIIGNHPEDFRLFFLGTFDELTGLFDSDSVPVSLGLAQQYKRVVDIMSRT